MKRPGPESLLAVCVIALTLVGCTDAPQRTSPSSNPVPQSGATATPSSEPPSRPGSRVALTCADIASLDTARSLTGYDGLVSVGPTDASFEDGSPLARVAMQRIGALDCAWRPSSAGTNADDAVLRVRVLAEPADETRQELTALWGGEPDVSCEEDYCAALVWTEHYGLHVSLSSSSEAASLSDREGWIASVIARVKALPAPAPLWNPPGVTAARSSTCDEITSPDVVSRLTGEKNPEADVTGPSPQLYFLSAARYLVGQRDCIWMGGSVYFLPGGASFIDSARQSMEGGALTSTDDGVSWASVSDGHGHNDVLAAKGSDLVLVSMYSTDDLDTKLELARTALANSTP